MLITVDQLDTPLEPLTLPRGPDGAVPGRTFTPQDFTLGMTKLAKRVNAGDEDAAIDLLRRCLPGITDEEIDCLTPAEVLWVFAYCARRLQQVTELVGNAAGAAGAATPSAPSAPTTSTTTPSLASPAPSAATGGKSRRNRSAAPSSLSIG